MIVHACPVASAVTSCCKRTPFELPRGDQMTVDPNAVTCGAPEAQLRARRTRIELGNRLIDCISCVRGDYHVIHRNRVQDQHGAWVNLTWRSG